MNAPRPPEWCRADRGLPKPACDLHRRASSMERGASHRCGSACPQCEYIKTWTCQWLPGCSGRRPTSTGARYFARGSGRAWGVVRPVKAPRRSNGSPRRHSAACRLTDRSEDVSEQIPQAQLQALVSLHRDGRTGDRVTDHLEFHRYTFVGGQQNHGIAGAASTQQPAV